MKKIFIFLNALNKGGAEVALINYLNSIDYKKYSVDLITYEKTSGLNVIDDLNKNVHFKSFFREKTKIGWLWKKLCHFLNGQMMTDNYQYAGYDLFLWSIFHKYDLTICYGEWFSPYYITNILRTKKKVLWIHNDLSQSVYLNNIQKFIFNFDLLVFPSKSSQCSSLKSLKIKEKKSIVVENILDFNKIRKLASQKINTQYSCNKLLLVTVANFRKQKNYHRCLQVAEILKKENIRFNWIMIGQVIDTDLFLKWDNLRKKLELENEVLFLGPKKNPYPYIKRADLFVLLSDHEGKPLAVSEAQCLNTPVIATDTSGTNELIINWQNGVLTNFKANSIAKVIIKIAKNPSIINFMRNNLKNENHQIYRNKDSDQIKTLLSA